METLSKHFRALTKTVFQKHGFQQADVLARWTEIVGPDLAAITKPERIRWPKGAEAQKQGGTLHVIAMAGRALDVQYAMPQLITRVNGYLGFGAISAIKVKASSHVPPPPRRKTVAVPPPHFSGIEDGDLQAALGRLAQAVQQNK